MALGNVTSKIGASNYLATLIDAPDDNFVGYVIRMNYDEVQVMTNDFWREKVNGLPQNSLLLATAFNPNDFHASKTMDQSIVLLRIQGPTRLPQDDDNLRTIIQHQQGHDEIMRRDDRDGIEPITHSLLQFGGLTCRVLGTFFLDVSSGDLCLGADIEDYQSATHLRVFKPTAAALERIVNYIDPIKRKKAIEDAQVFGFVQPPAPIEIGTVRFTSSNRLQQRHGSHEVPVCIQPSDFLARRTAVLGMTRTGKSNTVKTTVAAVAMSAAKAKLGIGQLIFDMNGEYSNANHQDDGSSISEVFEDDVVRYRGVETEGFFDLRDNFYQSLEAGLEILQFELRADGHNTGQDMQALQGLSLEAPSSVSTSERIRHERKVALYRALLKKAGFPHSATDDKISFSIGKPIWVQIFDKLLFQEDQDDAESEDRPISSTDDDKKNYAVGRFGDPKVGITLDQAVILFSSIRQVDRELRRSQRENNTTIIGIESTTKRKPWLDDVDRALLNLLAGESDNGTPIRSTRPIRNAGIDFHSPSGSDNIPRDVYQHLKRGRIVILDLSVGLPSVRHTLSERVAAYILKESMKTFTQDNNTPPNVVIYVEEAHNLIGRQSDLNETWPRIAKEGAKFLISLVYATQEPSSVHPNILANTENFFVTHLNNDDELRALSKYYDFGDFAPSLKKAQDVGFARIKTLSSPFVIPTQILKFEPSTLKSEYDALERRDGFEAVPQPGGGQ